MEPANFLRKDFYIDNGLKSVPTIEEAVSLICQTKEMCRCGGFNLHKFTSNKKEVIESIPVEDRAVSYDSDLVELWIKEKQILLFARESKKVYYHCDAKLFCIIYL